jgi:hypothetical protein
MIFAALQVSVVFRPSAGINIQHLKLTWAWSAIFNWGRLFAPFHSSVSERIFIDHEAVPDTDCSYLPPACNWSVKSL